MKVSEFARDVHEGLSDNPKRLSSKYFYDTKGDKLFQEIMAMESYYLTNAEFEIFHSKKEKILDLLNHEGHFRLLELGAGDGLKTKVLLKYFVEKEVEFTYAPIDISQNVLDHLEEDLRRELPSLDVNPLHGDYFQVLADLKLKSDTRNVVFFLGSNIGNYTEETARSFMQSMRENLNPGDIVLLGIDLKKEPKKIIAAYNDPEGITKRFNLNLLERINTELGGNFELDAFVHHVIYDPISGECRSYLLSKKEQTVSIADLDKAYHFQSWEPIFMEISKKYSPQEIDRLAHDSGFGVVENVFDQNYLFTDSIWVAQ